MNAPIRRVAHLDMDAFYASVELLRYPQLKGLPVVIGGARRREDEALRLVQDERGLAGIPVEAFPRLADYTGRGVITTATYAARQFGVGSALGLMKAAKLCPQAILLPVDFDEYRKYSRLFRPPSWRSRRTWKTAAWTRCISTSPTCPAASARADACWRA
jgi:DNA polymerase-4